MRRYEDPEGELWDVVVGRESWGAFVALFVPVSQRAGSEDVRQATLAASDAAAASRELESMGEAELRGLLARSRPRPRG